MRHFAAKLQLPAFLVLITMAASTASGSTLQEQLLEQAPPRLLNLARQFPDAPLSVSFVKADLDGSGRFQQIIAFYSESADPGLYLRVFQLQEAGLKLIGEQEDQETHGGAGWQAALVDIDGDGIPELDLSGTDSSGRQVMHEYFRWTGNSLHELLDPAKEMANDGALEDTTGDGRLELVVQHGANNFVVYRFNGSDFVAFETLKRDPLGTIGPDGAIHKVRAFYTALRPTAFSLEEVNTARHKDAGEQQEQESDHGSVELVMGKLRDLNGKPVSVDHVDAASIVLERGVRPIRFKIRSAHEAGGNLQEDGGREEPGPVLELQFARLDVLRLLAKSKLTGPLAAGDKIDLLAHGVLDDGMRVSAAVSAVITGTQKKRSRRY